VSGRHARIYFDEKKNSWFVEDLKSRNGTRVDGVRVTGAERLDALNVITFADKLDFIFQASVAAASMPAEKSQKPALPRQAEPPPKQKEKKTVVGDDAVPLPAFQPEQPDRAKTVYDDQPAAIPSFSDEPEQPEPKHDRARTVYDDEPIAAPDFGKAPPKEPPKQDKAKTVVGTSFEPTPTLQDKDPEPPQASASAQFVLEVQKTKGEKGSFTLVEGENIVGREPSNLIHIDDGSVSRKHAVLILAGTRVTVKDLGSKNGTMLNNERVNYEMEVKPGSTLMFGIVKAVLKKE
jgi:pSer/pThr/pTyr-binding forkhead associated (FHA) protein